MDPVSSSIASEETLREHAKSKATMIREKGIKVFDSKERRESHSDNAEQQDLRVRPGLGLMQQNTDHRTQTLSDKAHRGNQNITLGQNITGIKVREPCGTDILLVEDVKMARQIVIQAMKRAGFKKVDTAGSGEEAIQKFKQKEYKIILMDIQLPQMSGIDASKVIRRYERECNARYKVVILGLTASTSPEDLREYKGAEMNGCIAKGQLIAESVKHALEALGRNSKMFFVRNQHLRAQLQNQAAASGP